VAQGLTDGADDPAARLARASGAVSLGILASRVAGLLREKLLAYHLGTGLAAEAFRAALRIPNLLQNLLGDGVLAGAFVPTYARFVRDGRDAEAGGLAGAVASLLVLVTGGLVVLGVVLAEPLTRILTPGFPTGSPKAELTVALVRILFPSLGFLVLSAWCLGVLNAHRRFFRAYVAPVLWNAAIIISLSIAAAAGRGEVDLARAVAFGALIGAALQFLFQLPTVVRAAPGLRLRVGPDVPGLRDVLRASGGVILGRGIVQLSAYLDLAIASLLAAGAVAALGYAQVLYLLPVSLFGMSVAAAALPDLATIRVEQHARLNGDVERGLRRIASFVLPTAAIYLVFGDRAVALLFGGGAFSEPAIRQVALVLGAYGLGLLATTQARLLQSALYGLDDTVTPARVAGVRVAIGTTVGVGLMLLLDAYTWGPDGPLRVAAFGLAETSARASEVSLHRLGAVGLALGASVGAWVEWSLLRRALARRTAAPLVRPGWGRPVLAALAAVPALPVSEALVGALGPILDGRPVAVTALVALIPAAAAVVIAAVALGLDDLPGVSATRARVTRSISRRRRGTR
jgi:putative peptidoglycan lipid II flippase